MHLHVVEASGLNTMSNQSTVVGSLPFSLFGLGQNVNPIGYTMSRIKQRLVMQTLSQHNYWTTFFPYHSVLTVLFLLENNGFIWLLFYFLFF